MRVNIYDIGVGSTNKTLNFLFFLFRAGHTQPLTSMVETSPVLQGEHEQEFFPKMNV